MSSTSSISMCWTENTPPATRRQQKIDTLNDFVEKITAEAIQQSKKSGKPLPPSFVYAQKKMTILNAGVPVYRLRSATGVYLAVFIACGFIAKGALNIHPFIMLLCSLTSYLGYDLYSGILHVMMDHPDNISMPILGQACLEFQWHHTIPSDIVRKDFIDVCGDINMAVVILVPIYVCVLGINDMSLVMMGLKVLMAYYGQFSHRSAHKFGSTRDAGATWLQNKGFMISPKEHMAHHNPPHDVDFCLIGFCNPVIDQLRRLTRNNRIWWIALFCFWSIFDLSGYIKLVEGLAQFLQISN